MRICSDLRSSDPATMKLGKCCFLESNNSIGTKLALFTHFLLCLSSPIRAIHKQRKTFGLPTYSCPV